MEYSTRVNSGIEAIQFGYDLKNQPKTKAEVYQQVLLQQLNEIVDHCRRIGSMDGKNDSEEVLGASEPKKNVKIQTRAQKEQEIIEHGPIFLALLVVLFTGENSSYHVLARNMSDINNLMKKISQFTDDVKSIQDDLSKLMDGKGDLESITQDIVEKQKHLNELLIKEESALGSDMRRVLSDFIEKGKGSLDNLVDKATNGKCSNWEDASKDGAILDQVKKYMTGEGGGPAGEGITTVVQNISQLLGALNTQNQGQIEKLNMITKKVDASTKLFSSVITMYKGLTQTLTSYSGS